MLASNMLEARGYNPPKQAANLEKNVQTANIFFPIRKCGICSKL